MRSQLCKELAIACGRPVIKFRPSDILGGGCESIGHNLRECIEAYDLITPIF